MVLLSIFGHCGFQDIVGVGVKVSLDDSFDNFVTTLILCSLVFRLYYHVAGDKLEMLSRTGMVPVGGHP